MSFRINTNVAAMNAHTSSLQNNRNLSNSLAKLSSGLRINKAADDASGLAIANSLRAQASSLGQAISNGNDAIGLIQTADGALSEYSNILDTIKTKAVQAASDGQNTSSRLAIQKDIDRLMEQLDTIAKTTSFNGQKLLSGTFTNKEFQMGANANESIKASIASAVTSQIGQISTAKLSIASEGENQLTLKSATTGKEIQLASIDIQSNNNPDNGMGKLADMINEYTGETGISAKAVVESTTDVIGAGITGADFSINGVNIGAINVTANDADGTLLTAINNKSTETGVTATKTADGRLTLSSTDGRAIKVEGDLSGVTTSTGSDLSTIGRLEVTQAGSSTLQITGSEMGAAVGVDVELSSSMTTIEDSILAIGSTIEDFSTLGAGSTIGIDVTATVHMASNATKADYTLAAGTIIASGSTLNKGTEIVSTTNVEGNIALSADMLLKAGTVLGTGTRFDAGTVLQQDMTIAGVDYKAGTMLTTDAIFSAAEGKTTLSQDMVMIRDSANPNAIIGGGSSLAAGSILGADIVTSSDVTINSEMTLKEGSTIMSGSTLKAGSVIGEKIVLSNGGAQDTTIQMDLKVGSILATGSKLAENSTIGGSVNITAGVNLNQDMSIKAGSVLKSGTILAAGTVLQQDLTAAQAGDATGVGLSAGTVLGADITTDADISVTKDFTMVRGDDGTAKIESGSTLAANGGDLNSVQLSDETFTNLSDIDVTTLEGAMKAIDTVAAAIGNLDTIRSDLGSVQNQITSTINNISVTQVNVKAAESNIRDVDFAAESAAFSKFNILSQAGSYAMSQANAVQQNVLRLLQ